MNSSSWILKFQFDEEERIWGKFYNLFTDDRLKLKELIVDPKKGLSFQNISIEMKYGLLVKAAVLSIILRRS